MERKDGEGMVIKIDFESEEAIYVQLKNQIILGLPQTGFGRGILFRLSVSSLTTSGLICIQ